MSSDQINFEQIARNVCAEVGYTGEAIGLDGANCQVITNIQAQDANIFAAVHANKADADVGAGDQGLMFGYATNEWDQETLHPLSHQLANKLGEEMAIKRKNGQIPWLRPDCKTQVIIEYENSNGKLRPLRVYNILISTQHDPEITNEVIRETITEQIIKQVIPESLLVNTHIVINPSGKFD